MKNSTQQLPANHKRKLLRKMLRQKRRALSPQQQQRHANQLRNQIKHLPAFKRAKRVAVYLSQDGEIDLSPTIKWIWKAKKSCFLPVLNQRKRGHLFFSPFKPKQALVKNRFGIPEPRFAMRNMYLARRLDLILMPLVGFDRTGNRIGMGGGFYDRTFAYLNTKGNCQRPKLVGVAHSIQEAEQLPFQAWDIPMQAIITEQEVIVAKKTT